MKKLLSLLSVLTIGGTAVPTTIAASPYQKQETIKNSDINYEQTNNLEILNREKRDKVSDKSCQNFIAIGVGIGGGSGAGAVAGAAAGATIGSVVPGLGTAVGAGLGAVVGTFTGSAVGAGVGYVTANGDICAKEINEFVLNTDLKIIEDDNNTTILREVKKLNQSLNIENLYVIDKSNTSAKIVASNASPYKAESYVIVKFINQRHLNLTPNLLKNWSDNYNEWVNEFNRQKKEDVPSFSIEQKRTWKDDKNFQIRTQFHSLLQNIVIICKVKMQIGQLALIKLILYLLLKIATIFSKKNIFFELCSYFDTTKNDFC
ncbi:MAG: hypothetical protein SPLM_10170 [Spiroplasma phoeniceum]|uniref:glycine zipper family protein n=1 Tax=Spiroplasma phoeniceum TaxID=47835 RepID=UPI0031341B23